MSSLASTDAMVPGDIVDTFKIDWISTSTISPEQLILNTNCNFIQLTEVTLSHQSSYGLKIYFEAAVLAIGVVGFIANALMLFVLSYFKENRQQTTNVLILNQTALDLLSCIALIIAYSIKLHNVYFNNDVTGYILCYVFYCTILSGIGMSGSICGLVTIALERYFKIVHSILHKKFYRRWMLHLAVAVPWIYGVITNVPVILVSAIIVEGQCIPLASWIRPSHQFAYGIFIIICNFFLPVFILSACYGRIALVIKQRSKSKKLAHRAKALIIHRKRKNVIKTLILISAVFALCWLPIQIYFILLNAGFNLSLTSNLWYLSVFVSYINPVLNPILYSWQYETVRLSVRLIIDGLRGGAVNRSKLPETSGNGSTMYQDDTNNGNAGSSSIFRPSPNVTRSPRICKSPRPTELFLMTSFNNKSAAYDVSDDGSLCLGTDKLSDCQGTDKVSDVNLEFDSKPVSFIMTGQRVVAR